LAELRQTAQHRLSQPDPALLQYGAELGDGVFREVLAQFLTHHCGFGAEAEHLMITSGISQTLDLICTVFTRPGEVVFVEEPSYFLAFGIFKDHGLNVVGIPTDERGLNTEALEEALNTHHPKLLYTIPAFQNPTGTTLSPGRRQRLMELADEYGFLVVADEVYQLLHYGETPPWSLARYLRTGRVLSLGSFSKILAPGLRLGWVQAAPELLGRLAQHGVVASGGGLNPFVSALVLSALETGLQEAHLHRLRTTYQERLNALLSELERIKGIRFHRPSGGYFVWLELNPALDTQALLDKAARAGVRFQPGVKFSSQQGLHHCLRLCFAYYETPELRLGVQRLAGVMG
jgi:DNA-binding transcriptional MocR family regulator